MLKKETTIGTLNIRTYRDGDEVSITQLFKTVFGKEKKEEHWRWEFLNNPYGTQIMLAFLNSTLVAQCAAIPVKIRTNRGIFSGAQVVDCMTHPKYRGIAISKKGIFALTVLEFFREFGGCNKTALVYGFPSERHYKLGEKLMGYRKLLPIAEVIIHPHSTRKLLRRIQMISTREALVHHQKNLREYAERHTPLGKISLLKEWKYVEWRYLTQNHTEYQFAMLKSGFKKGFAVLKPEEDHLKLLDSFSIPPWNAAALIASHTKKPVIMWIPKSEKWLSQLPNTATIRDPFIKAVPCAVNLCEDFISWEDLTKDFFYQMGDSDLF